MRERTTCGALKRVVEAGTDDYYDEAEELKKRVDIIGNNYFNPSKKTGLNNDPVAEGFVDEDDDGEIPPGTTEEELRDYNVNEVVFDNDATVSNFDFDTDDSEIWQSIDKR